MTTPYEDWAKGDPRDDPFVGYIGIDRDEFKGLPEYDEDRPDAYDIADIKEDNPWT